MYNKFKHLEGFQTCASHLLLDELGVYKTDFEIRVRFLLLILYFNIEIEFICTRMSHRGHTEIVTKRMTNIKLLTTVTLSMTTFNDTI